MSIKIDKGIKLNLLELIYLSNSVKDVLFILILKKFINMSLPSNFKQFNKDRIWSFDVRMHLIAPHITLEIVRISSLIEYSFVEDKRDWAIFVKYLRREKRQIGKGKWKKKKSAFEGLIHLKSKFQSKRAKQIFLLG